MFGTHRNPAHKLAIITVSGCGKTVTSLAASLMRSSIQRCDLLRDSGFDLSNVKQTVVVTGQFEIPDKCGEMVGVAVCGISRHPTKKVPM